MKLTRRDLSTLLKGFPNIELSYEKNIHKKVPSSNIYLTIPKGRKYFAWFKYWNKHSVCFLLELDRYKKNIQTIFIKKLIKLILTIRKDHILYLCIGIVSKNINL